MISTKVEIDPLLEGLNKSAVILIIKNVLESEGIQDASISFIFGSDELLSGLKKEFFNKNQWTDVIAFRMNDYKEEVVEGEIYISIPRAKDRQLASPTLQIPKRQSRARERCFDKHCCMMVLNVSISSTCHRATMTPQLCPW